MKSHVFCLFFALLAATACGAADWVHRQGPVRNGTVPWNSGWGSLNWSLDTPRWTARCGVGGSTPMVTGGRLYALGWEDGKEVLTCFEAETGDPIWNQSYKCPPYGRFAIGDQGLYKGPVSTPEYDRRGKQIFTLGIDGDLFCWSEAKGNSVWHRNLYDQLRVEQRPKVTRTGHRDYGYTSSPLVAGPWCIVEAGSPVHGTVIAFNRTDGEVAWRSACRDEAGHNNGPSPMMVDGVPCLAVFTLRHFVVMRIDPGHEGETVAQVPWETDYAQNVASPAVVGSDVVITAGYNHKKMVRYRISLAGGAKKVWEQRIASKICTPVHHEGSLYFAYRRLTCLDYETGETRWTGGSFGEAGSVVVTADDKVLAWGGNGNFMLAESAAKSPAACTVLAERTGIFRTDVWPHLVFTGKRLYLKDRVGNLNAYALDPEEP